MKIVKFVFPPLDNNVYVVYDEEKLEGYIIDIALGADAIYKYVINHNLKILALINTHAHIDHTAHNSKIKKMLNIKIAIHENDVYLLRDFFKKQYPYIYEELEYVEPDIFLKDNDVLKFGKYEFKVIHTPGHTPGSIVLYEEGEKVLFTGDTLFAGTYGRVDFPYSSEIDMMKSLRKIAKLPKDVKVYPGHYEETKLEYEYWIYEL